MSGADRQNEFSRSLASDPPHRVSVRARLPAPASPGDLPRSAPHVLQKERAGRDERERERETERAKINKREKGESERQTERRTDREAATE